MRGDGLLPLDPSITLADVLRVAPREPCGVWIESASRWERLRVPPAASGPCTMLLLHDDLGALIRVVPIVIVRLDGRVLAVSSKVLALARMLEVLSEPALPPRPIADGSAEALLTERRGAGVVRGSRIVYRDVDARAGPSLG